VPARSSFPIRGTAGTARLLAHLGFEALATTSAGYAFSAGQPDNTIDRGEMLAHVSAIASATGLPVSADLENGFADDPETVAETIRLAAAAGAVGGSHRRYVAAAGASHL
jgi:2-methylisocitrate lyase-like PEP mutase family enzyme